MAVVDQLVLSELTSQCARGGATAQHPAVLLNKLIGGCATDVFSSREIERGTHNFLALCYEATHGFFKWCWSEAQSDGAQDSWSSRLAHHHILSCGVTGLGICYVIGGFLITAFEIDEVKSLGRFGFNAFIIREMLRLF